LSSQQIKSHQLELISSKQVGPLLILFPSRENFCLIKPFQTNFPSPKLSTSTVEFTVLIPKQQNTKEVFSIHK